MDSLPDEIFLQIFSFIPPKWRRETAAFVCRRWYRIATDRLLTKNEEIILSKKLGAFEHLAPHLANAHRNTFNLHFYRENFRRNEQFYDSWHLCGQKISSLTFDTCNLESTLFTDILKFCPNLDKLSLDFIRLNYIEEPLVMPSVTSLDLNIPPGRRKPPNENELYNFLSVFPKLTDLKLKIPRLMEHMLNPLCKYNEDTGKRLKTLTLQGGTNWPYTVHPDSISWLPKSLNKLDNVNVVFGMWLSFNELPATISPQLVANKITVLSLTIDSENVATPNFVLDVLNNCNNLVYLTIIMRWRLNMNGKIIEKILASRLKTFKYEPYDYRVDVTEDLDGHFVPNYFLESINLSGECIHLEKLCAIFLEYSKNLRKVKIKNPTDNILQNIFKHQKRLKSLTLDPCAHDCTNFGFTGIRTSEDDSTTEKAEEAYSISELKELEYLQISYCGTWREESQRTEKFLFNFHLPELKIFKIGIGGWDPTAVSDMLSTLVDGLKNSPHLEFIRFQFSNFHEKTVFAPLLETLKHLKIFICDENYHSWFTQHDDIDDETAYEFFKTCPSLRKFNHNCTSFFYNILTTTINKFRESCSSIDFRNSIYYTCDPEIYL